MDKTWVHGYAPYVLEDEAGEGRVQQCLDGFLEWRQWGGSVIGMIDEMIHIRGALNNTSSTEVDVILIGEFRFMTDTPTVDLHCSVM